MDGIRGLLGEPLLEEPGLMNCWYCSKVRGYPDLKDKIYEFNNKVEPRHLLTNSCHCREVSRSIELQRLSEASLPVDDRNPMTGHFSWYIMPAITFRDPKMNSNRRTVVPSGSCGIKTSGSVSDLEISRFPVCLVRYLFATKLVALISTIAGYRILYALTTKRPHCARVGFQCKTIAWYTAKCVNWRFLFAKKWSTYNCLRTSTFVSLTLTSPERIIHHSTNYSGRKRQTPHTT